MADKLAALWRFGCIITVILHLSTAYQHFSDNIPNGNAVPNPCKPEKIWTGVGHKRVGGTGARNPFGLDFAANGKCWTTELCQKDSDLDGRTNGQELGDPNCTWSQGMPNPTGFTISHPGICEPWNDPKCLARDQSCSWVMEVCQPSEFKCDAIQSAGVANKTLRIPRTKVPRSETTYMCQIFSIPKDKDYHIIATTPIIDNTNVMHHAVLFGCTVDVPESTEPFSCNMIPHEYCQSVVSIWTPGSAGECMHSSSGFRMGASGFKNFALQLHWNNPKFQEDYFDESGMTMYFTSNLRANDAGILTIGLDELLIPPGESLVRSQAVYPGDCSQRDMSGNIYVTAVLNHMHYLGIHQYLELYRGGVKIRDIASDPDYNYDNPQLHIFGDPMEIRPGDELRTRCEYSSTTMNSTTMFGEATSDEMCFSFITYYPKDNARRTLCLSRNSISICRLDNPVYEGCEWRTFRASTDLDMYKKVTNSCVLLEPCTQTCNEAVKSARQHVCLKGDIWTFLIHRFFRNMTDFEFLMRLQSCDCGVPSIAPEAFTPITTEQSTCDWPGLASLNQDHLLYQLYINVTQKCIATGPCLKECIPAVQAARGHRCFQRAEWHYGRRYLHQSLNSKALEFLMDFESCNCEIQNTAKTTTTLKTPPTGSTPSITQSCNYVIQNTAKTTTTLKTPRTGSAPSIIGFCKLCSIISICLTCTFVLTK